ncbi:UNVERIFIED_CONTAM: hypothetical protein HDU68_010443 [Siphonaria sp. JEL0065]|nr:hypothetical protein HDU68_010443 [Siphonaria sp. JEL0065]
MFKCVDFYSPTDLRFCGVDFGSGYATIIVNADWWGYDLAAFPDNYSFEQCAQLTRQLSSWFFTFNGATNTCYVKDPKYNWDAEDRVSLYALDNNKNSPWVLPGYDFPNSFDTPITGNVVADAAECKRFCMNTIGCMAVSYEPQTRRCYRKIPIPLGQDSKVISGIITRLK